MLRRLAEVTGLRLGTAAIATLWGAAVLLSPSVAAIPTVAAVAGLAAVAAQAALLWHYREPREAAEAPALAVEDTEFYAAVNQIAFRQMWGGEDVVEVPDASEVPAQPADPASAPAVWAEAP